MSVKEQKFALDILEDCREIDSKSRYNWSWERDLILLWKQHVKLKVLNSDANVIDAYTESEENSFQPLLCM